MKLDFAERRLSPDLSVSVEVTYPQQRNPQPNATIEDGNKDNLSGDHNVNSYSEEIQKNIPSSSQKSVSDIDADFQDDITSSPQDLSEILDSMDADNVDEMRKQDDDDSDSDDDLQALLCTDNDVIKNSNSCKKKRKSDQILDENVSPEKQLHLDYLSTPKCTSDLFSQKNQNSQSQETCGQSGSQNRRSGTRNKRKSDENLGENEPLKKQQLSKVDSDLTERQSQSESGSNISQKSSQNQSKSGSNISQKSSQNQSKSGSNISQKSSQNQSKSGSISQKSSQNQSKSGSNISQKSSQNQSKSGSNLSQKSCQQKSDSTPSKTSKSQRGRKGLSLSKARKEKVTKAEVSNQMPLTSFFKCSSKQTSTIARQVKKEEEVCIISDSESDGNVKKENLWTNECTTPVKSEKSESDSRLPLILSEKAIQTVRNMVQVMKKSNDVKTVTRRGYCPYPDHGGISSHSSSTSRQNSSQGRNNDNDFVALKGQQKVTCDVQSEQKTSESGDEISQDKRETNNEPEADLLCNGLQNRNGEPNRNGKYR